MAQDAKALLETDRVGVSYGKHKEVRALDGVSVVVHEGTSVGIAGESGSGKSTLLRMLLRLEDPTDGEVRFEGLTHLEMDSAVRRRFHASVQAVFQDPGSALNPRHKIWRSITEPAWVVSGASKTQRRELAADLLAHVDLPLSARDKLPHQLSGGERQRVTIARAVSSHPRVVLLDEPVTALDISVRGHVINLLRRKAAEDSLTYVVVSHDLSAIYHLTDYLYVMFEGRVVEQGPTVEVVGSPQHPYTQTLVAAVEDPLADPEPQGGFSVTAGACRFIARCPLAMEQCRTEPDLIELPGSRAARCVRVSREAFHEAPSPLVGSEQL